MLTEIIIFFLLILFIWGIVKKPSNYPPGLWGLPLIGYIPLGAKNFDEKFKELRKEHGELFCWRIGSRLLVFICGYKKIKEAYNSPVFANRPKLGFFTFLIDEFDIGMLNSNGVHWQNIRRFTLRHLRDLGMGKSKMESAVQHEAMVFVKELEKQAGKPAMLPRALKPAILNVIWQMVAGKRYEYTHKNIVEFDNIVSKLQNNFSRFIILDIFTWISSVCPTFILNKVMMKDLQIELSTNMREFYEREIEEHISTLDENNPRDFIDEYLIEMEKQKVDPESTMSLNDLTGCISDLFGAGSETTAATIYWAILCLAKFPDVQRKLQKEIDDVLPDETLASLDHKSKLPYTEAFINEILRFRTLAAYGIQRTVLSDATFGGYLIPKDAIVFSATEAHHFDPTHFDSPEEFRPERFINSDGKVELPKSGFFPFGIGKRQCLGESLARMELLIFLTTMLKFLKFSAPPNKEIDIRPMDMPLFNNPRVNQDVLITIRDG